VLISDQWGRRGWECAGGFDMHVYCVHYTICSDWLIYLVNDLPICLGTSLLTYLFTYLLTYLLTPCSTVLLEKLTGSQLVNKFPA